jgi:hypothetical protein
VAWGFSGFAGRCTWCHLVSSPVSRRRCAAVVTDIWRTDPGPSKRLTEPLARRSRWPAVPSRPGERSLVGGRSGPRMAHRIRGQSREPCWYRGIALDGFGTVPPGSVALHLRCDARTAGRQSWPAWPAQCGGCPWVNRLPASRCRGNSADLLLTGDVPAVDLSGTSRASGHEKIRVCGQLAPGSRPSFLQSCGH